MRCTQMPLCHASVEFSFVTDAAAKMLKNATYFLLIMDSPGGYGPLTYTLKTVLVELMLSSN